MGPTTDLTSTIQGNDLFYNGVASDAPYDLLVDMQHIGDILFSDNQQTDKTLFFTFPSNSIAGFQSLYFDGDTSNSTVNNPIDGSASNNANNSQSNSQQGSSNQNNNLPSMPTNP